MNANKKKNNPREKSKSAPTLSELVSDPFFEKKHEAAQRNLDKYGLPEELLKKNK